MLYLAAVPGLLPVVVILPRKHGPCLATTTSSGRERCASPTSDTTSVPDTTFAPLTCHITCFVQTQVANTCHLTAWCESQSLDSLPGFGTKTAALRCVESLGKLVGLANSNSLGAKLMICKQRAANSSVLKRRANFSTFKKTAYYSRDRPHDKCKIRVSLVECPSFCSSSAQSSAVHTWRMPINHLNQASQSQSWM